MHILVKLINIDDYRGDDNGSDSNKVNNIFVKFQAGGEANIVQDWKDACGCGLPASPLRGKLDRIVRIQYIPGLPLAEILRVQPKKIAM